MFVSFGMIDFLNSREDALLFWVLVAVGLGLYRAPGLAPSLANVVRSFLAPKLLILWVTSTAYVAVAVSVAESFGLWHPTSLKETVYWLAGTGLILAGGATQTRGDPAEFIRLLRRALRLTIFLEFFINFWVLPLGVELILIPLMALLLSLNVVAERDSNFTAVKRLIERVLLLIGVGLLIFVTASVVGDLGRLFTYETLEQLLIAPTLTLVFIPFLYLVAVVTAYEQIFIRIDIFLRDNRPLARQTKRATLRACGLNLRRVGRFSGRFYSKLAALRNERDLTELLREFANTQQTPQPT